MKGVGAAGEKGLLEIMAASHTGVQHGRVLECGARWTRNRAPSALQSALYRACLPADARAARIPPRQRPPDLRLSGGGIEFMRPWMEKVDGIRRAGRGSSGSRSSRPMGRQTRADEARQGRVHRRWSRKTVGINRFIGWRPIFPFGSSDGDLQMLQWTMVGQAPLRRPVDHTDAEREYAYDRSSKIGKLEKALEEANAKRWTVVEMCHWKAIFHPLNEGEPIWPRRCARSISRMKATMRSRAAFRQRYPSAGL